MKTRFLMLLAAMLLGTASAFAQSGNNEPLKGDVNGDGKVDVADITAVIKIMKDGGGTSEETKYYWYAGQTQPSSMTSNPTVDDTNFTNNKWHTLNGNQISQTIKGGTAGNSWYVAVPTVKGFSAYASDLVTPNTAWNKITTITVKSISYDVWKPASTGAKMNVYMTVTPTQQQTYYWYVGHENPMEMTNITPLPSNDVSEGPGWRTIGKTLPTYTKESPLWNSTVISTASTKSTQYMALPSPNIKSRNAISGEDNTDEAWNNIGSKQLNGVIYTIYSSLNIKKSFADLLY